MRNAGTSNSLLRFCARNGLDVSLFLELATRRFVHCRVGILGPWVLFVAVDESVRRVVAVVVVARDHTLEFGDRFNVPGTQGATLNLSPNSCLKLSFPFEI
jgi:hypothetical protein